jgi:hypothetical protein
MTEDSHHLGTWTLEVIELHKLPKLQIKKLDLVLLSLNSEDSLAGSRKPTILAASEKNLDIPRCFKGHPLL